MLPGNHLCFGIGWGRARQGDVGREVVEDAERCGKKYMGRNGNEREREKTDIQIDRQIDR